MPEQRIEQRELLRAEQPLPGTTIVVRGGRDTVGKLRSHALRTARAWSLDGLLLGISVFAVLGIALDELLARRFATSRTVYLPTASKLGERGFELLATGQQPHYTVRLRSADDQELGELLAALGPAQPNLHTVEAASGGRRAEMYRVDITADLNDEDQTGYVWTFLDEARDPAQITPGALVVAGDEDAAAICQVVNMAPAGDGTIVHLRLLPGLVDDYRALAERAMAS